MSIPDKFSALFDHPRPALAIKFSRDADEEPIIVGVKHIIGPKLTVAGRRYIDDTCKGGHFTAFSEFYEKYNGLGTFAPFGQPSINQRSLLQFMPADRIEEFTSLYVPGGDRAWIIDLNKSKHLYRSGDKWIAFALVGNGPSCLCMFLTGQNIGNIFFAEPQPHFNIAKPIAKDFTALLDRIGKDPVGFLKLVLAYVTVRRADGQGYGYLATSYTPDAGEILPAMPTNKSFWERIFGK